MTDDVFFDEDAILDDELSLLRRKRLEEMEKKLFAKENCAVSVVDELSFPGFTGQNRYAVLDMWAEWCGPCRRVAPVIEELAQEFCGEVAFGKCNTDENQNLTRKYSISAIPTLLFFSGGQLADRLTGAYPKEAIKSRIKSVFML